MVCPLVADLNRVFRIPTKYAFAIAAHDSRTHDAGVGRVGHLSLLLFRRRQQK
jgi:hypothetical protein